MVKLLGIAAWGAAAAQAHQVVLRLPSNERQRLRTAALVLHRAQQCVSVHLPLPIAWQILSMCADS